MTRTETIQELADRTGMEKKDVKNFLEQLTSLVEDVIRQGGEVPLKGLGKFRVQHRKARVGRNPIISFSLSRPVTDIIVPHCTLHVRLSLNAGKRERAY